MPRRGFSGYLNVYTRASNTEERFFPDDTPVKSSNNTKALHAILDVYASTANIRLVPAIQESDDPDNWPAATTFTAVGSLAMTADGITGSDAYSAVTLSKAYWRSGVVVRNNTADALRIEHALVATRFDVRST